MNGNKVNILINFASYQLAIIVFYCELKKKLCNCIDTFYVVLTIVFLLYKNLIFRTLTDKKISLIGKLYAVLANAFRPVWTFSRQKMK